MRGAEVLDAFRGGHRAATRRDERAHRGRVEQGRLHARGSRSVPAVHGDPRLRLLVPRPGHPRSDRRARISRRSRRRHDARRASHRRGFPTSSARRPALPPDTTVVFDVQGAPPMLSTVHVPPEGRAVLLDAPPASPTVTLGMDRRTFTRSRAVVGRASRLARKAWCGSVAIRSSATASSTTWRSRSSAAYAPPHESTSLRREARPRSRARDRQPPAAQPRAHPDEARRHGRSGLPPARLGRHQAPPHRHLRLGLEAGLHGLRRRARRRQPDEGVLLVPAGARARGRRRRRGARSRGRGPRGR